MMETDDDRQFRLLTSPGPAAYGGMGLAKPSEWLALADAAFVDRFTAVFAQHVDFGSTGTHHAAAPHAAAPHAAAARRRPAILPALPPPSKRAPALAPEPAAYSALHPPRLNAADGGGQPSAARARRAGKARPRRVAARAMCETPAGPRAALGGAPTPPLRAPPTARACPRGGARASDRE